MFENYTTGLTSSPISTICTLYIGVSHSVQKLRKSHDKVKSFETWETNISYSQGQGQFRFRAIELQ
jgi:hypothetical protein